MVRFTLFGVPVEIQPWFWLTAAMLGGGLRASTPHALQQMMFFIFASTISILVHEFGHALVGRRLGGGWSRIVLWAFGGLAYNEGGRFTKWQRFWMIAAGPGAGFVFFLVIVAILAIAFGPGDAIGLAKMALFNGRAALSDGTYDFFMERAHVFSLVHSFLWINFWWGLINLLPVLPLDGGQIAELFIKPQQRVYQVAIAASVSMAAVGLWMGSIYTALLFGFLAWRNYQMLQFRP